MVGESATPIQGSRLEFPDEMSVMVLFAKTLMTPDMVLFNPGHPPTIVTT
jgi:hypothetical protein